MWLGLPCLDSNSGPKVVCHSSFQTFDDDVFQPVIFAADNMTDLFDIAPRIVLQVGPPEQYLVCGGFCHLVCSSHIAKWYSSRRSLKLLP